MMISEYIYSKNDLLKNPQSYQKSSFGGIDFLNSFKKSRLDKLDLCGFEQFSLPNFLAELKFLKKSHTFKGKLEEYLIFLLLQSESNTSKKHVDILLKKFEIKKKLYIEYDGNFKETTDDCYYLKNYLLFAILCIIQYEKYSSLKYLNTLLKINDVLCSQTHNIPVNDKPLFGYIIKKELENIQELCLKKGIKI